MLLLVPFFTQPREVVAELKKLTEVLEKLQHRARDSYGRNLYDEVANYTKYCHIMVNRGTFLIEG